MNKEPQDEGERCGILDLDAPELYINREISWLSFNRRVLEEALDPSHPLLERVKFLAICGSKLDEFFMVRVSGLLRQVEEGALEIPPDGMTPTEQLAAIRTQVSDLYPAYARCWKDELMPTLADAGIIVRRTADLDAAEKAALRRTFEASILPTLTPMAFDAAHPFPFISNLGPSLAVAVRDTEDGSSHFARVKVPGGMFSRFYPMDGGGREQSFIFLEDLVAANLDLLFPGMEIADDVSLLFNTLTGYARSPGYKKLLVAPASLKTGIISRIDREIERHRERGDGHIAWKMNGLLDKDVIRALYRASEAGVRVDLNVRGLCARACSASRRRSGCFRLSGGSSNTPGSIISTTAAIPKCFWGVRT